jgi:hypothetical protein
MKEQGVRSVTGEVAGDQVSIPEQLFYDMVDLLKAPKSLVPSEGKCILHMAKRNDVLHRLLRLRREIVLP